MSDVEKNIGTHKPQFNGEWVKLGDITKIITGKLDANAANENGRYPFFTCAEKALRIDTAAYDCECVLVAGNGDLNVKYYNGPFNAYQRTYIIESNSAADVCVPYLYHFLSYYVATLRAQSIGGVIKYIKLGNLKDARLLLPPLEKQKAVSSIFELIDKSKHECDKQLSNLNDLVKSQFMEMFSECLGDKVSLSDVVWFQEGPGVRNYQYTAHGVKLLNVANLHDGELDISNTGRYISEEEAYGRYRHFLVEEGDLIIASSGIKVDYFDQKMGFAKKEQLPLCMNTSTIRFRAIDSRLNMIFFMYYLKSDDFKQQLARQITGSAQLNFGPSHLKKMSVPMPPFVLQQQFADFVAQVDKLGFDVQQQIEKLETLKQSLMQEYFG